MKYSISVGMMVLLISTLFIGCKLRIGSVTETKLSSKVNDTTLTCTIQALNLSEDMSVISSKNDEIYYLVYERSDSSIRQLSSYRFAGIFDKNKTTHSFSISANAIQSASLVLIEEDSDRPIETIDSIVAVHLDSLTKYYRNEDYTLIRSILGDDDVLSIIHLAQIQSNFEYRIQGIHKMDKYLYFIKFE